MRSEIAYPYHSPDADLVLQCIERGMTNVVCSNDATAIELMHTLYSAGVGIPGDVRKLGYDDVKFARLTPVALTTFYQPCDTLCELAIETILNRLAHPGYDAVTNLATPKLVARDSSMIP